MTRNGLFLFMRDTLVFVVALLLLAHCSEVVAGPVGTPTQNAIVLMRGDNGNTGTGFIVDPSGIIVTAKHCDFGETATIGMLTIPQKRAVKVLSTTQADGALIYQLPAGETYPFIKIAATPPRIGDAVSSHGYPGLGQGFMRSGSGNVVGFGESEGDPLVKANFSVGTGWSGGPLLNRNEEAVGVLVLAGFPNGPESWSEDSFWSSHEDLVKTVSQVANVPTQQFQQQQKARATVFTADWCGACRRLKNDYNAGLHSDIEFNFVNYDLASPEWQAFIAECKPENGQAAVPVVWFPGTGEYTSGYVGPRNFLELIGERLRRIFHGPPPKALIVNSQGSTPNPIEIQSVPEATPEPKTAAETEDNKAQVATDELRELIESVKALREAEGLAKIKAGADVVAAKNDAVERLSDVKRDPQAYLFGLVGLAAGAVYKRRFA